MKPKYRKVYALAPSNVATGGPELTHQLIHAIRSLGGDAAVHYVPDPSAAVPAAYRHYDVDVSRAKTWGKGDAIVFPETMLRLMPMRNPATPYVWWQSYDNAVDMVSSPARQLASRAFKLALCHVQQRWSDCRHVFQSYYARDKLEKWGFSGEMLSDYVVARPESFTNDMRARTICFNPKKGFGITSQIIAANPDLTFAPIANMTKQQVLQLLESAMIYLDFGGHPGKDRLPREAALRGAVVLVGQRGSAANALDVALDAQYKLPLGRDLVARASAQVRSVLDGFAAHQEMQSCFRAALHGEHSTFQGQVKTVFFSP